MRILLVWVSDGEEQEWVDSCWTEDKQEAAIERAMLFRDNGFNSAVVAYAVNHHNTMCNDWDEDSQEMILQWEYYGE